MRLPALSACNVDGVLPALKGNAELVKEALLTEQSAVGNQREFEEQNFNFYERLVLEPSRIVWA